MPTGGIAVVVVGVVAVALSAALQWCSEVQHKRSPSEAEDGLVHYTRLLPGYTTDSKRPSLETDTGEGVSGQPMGKGASIMSASINEKLKKIPEWRRLRDNATDRHAYGNFLHVVNAVRERLSPSYREIDAFSFKLIDKRCPPYTATPDLCDGSEFDEHGADCYHTKRMGICNDMEKIRRPNNETSGIENVSNSSLPATNQARSHHDCPPCTGSKNTKLTSGFKHNHAFQAAETAQRFETSVPPPTAAEVANESQENLPGLGQRRGMPNLRVVLPSPTVISHGKISLVPYTPTPTPHDTAGDPWFDKSPDDKTHQMRGLSTLTADGFETQISPCGSPTELRPDTPLQINFKSDTAAVTTSANATSCFSSYGGISKIFFIVRVVRFVGPPQDKLTSVKDANQLSVQWSMAR
ncbi:hypothetical protein Bbelb_171920 [Branchiostoma belcheri]|nr:hypothetical protein Bbelb_171920 [Branchiostoma belcheri]